MSGMSAPSIPNLLTLRGGSRGGSGIRGRTRGRGRGQGGAPSTPDSAATHDATIQGTDTDAAVSRMSAVDLGYLQDRYAYHFVQRTGMGMGMGMGMDDPVRRLPIINRGTYTRTAAIDSLIGNFLSVTRGQERQIISLGAGTDTRVFRLFNEGGQKSIIYHEIDFPIMSNKKSRLIKTTPALRAVIPKLEYVAETETWRGEELLGQENRYWCHGLDLRDLSKSDLTGLRTDLPTLLLSECCLCYLEAAEASKVIGYFTERIPDLAVVLYEPIHPDDPFGKQMVSNLAARRIRMPTLEVYTDTSRQKSRLREAGFSAANSLTIEAIWENWVPTQEKERVDGLEGLDEVEEWNLLASHYCVSWGWRGSSLEGWGGGPT
ncbi:leucine carboxyl methyltransferase [Poronia punctata]|nr:leucine carboxyl methyltransferase [Poronia punctata]